ncbi:F-box protein [Melia azedarach]|uniref:F-box protein n=1 Tax=Melia azedarach TaxID=155640 RepID=A0ACC1YEK0_MELAZ|nr:F-box protein [Melia azedarach]
MKQKKIRIPNDIIFGMLSKLPAKSLVRFKSVCTLWRSFVTDLRYDSHVIIFSSSSSIQSVFFQESGSIKLVPLELPVKSPLFLKVVGACDGLLCVPISSQSILWNPWTGRYKILPIPETWSFEQFGLGYDRSTNDYKTVRVKLHDIQIYSVNSNSLKTLPLPWLIDFESVHWGTFGISINGALHWPIVFFGNVKTTIKSFTWEFTPATLEKQCSCILRLDLTHQQCRLIHLPDDLGHQPKFELLDFDGRICVVHYRDEGHIDMWIMENLEEQDWIKLMSIPRLEELHSDDYLSPDFINKNGEVLMNIRRKYRNRQRTNWFCLYKPKKKTFKRYEIETSKRFYQVITYTKSLISPVQLLPHHEERLVEAS